MEGKTVKINKITKNEISRAISELIYEGYRGGYRIASNLGWAYDPSTKKYAVDRIYKELQENPYQIIEIAIYEYDKKSEKWKFTSTWNKIIYFDENNIIKAIENDFDSNDYTYGKMVYEYGKELQEKLDKAFMEGRALTTDEIIRIKDEFLKEKAKKS